MSTSSERTDDIWTSRFWRILAALAVTGLVLRYLATHIAGASAFGVAGDGLWYVDASRALADGLGYINVASVTLEKDALHPPLWHTLLSVPVRLGFRDLQQLQYVAALIGTTTIVLTGMAGRRIAGPRAGLLAAALVVFYPGFWLYERNLNAETLVFPLMALALLLVYRYHDRPNWGDLVGLSVVIGLLAMTRSELIALGPFVVVPLVLGCAEEPWRKRVSSLAVAAVLVLVVITPWALHNASRFEEPVLLSTGAGNAMAAGACDETFSGEKLGSYDPACVYRVGLRNRELDNSELDPALRDAAVDYSIDNLGRLPVVLFAREGRTWSFYAPRQQARLHSGAVNAPVSAVWAHQIVYWLLLPPAAVGAVVLHRRRVPIYPLLAIGVVVLLSSAITFGDIRYRATIELPLVLLAAIGIDAIVARQMRGERLAPAHTEPVRRRPSSKSSKLATSTAQRLRRRLPTSSTASRNRDDSGSKRDEEPVEGFAARIQRQEAEGAARDRSASPDTDSAGSSADHADPADPATAGTRED